MFSLLQAFLALWVGTITLGVSIGWSSGLADGFSVFAIAWMFGGAVVAIHFLIALLPSYVVWFATVSLMFRIQENSDLARALGSMTAVGFSGGLFFVWSGLWAGKARLDLDGINLIVFAAIGCTVFVAPRVARLVFGTDDRPV